MKKRTPSESILRSIREATTKTSDRLAEIAEVNRQIVYRAEQQKTISDDSAEKVAKALGICSDIVFYNMGRIPPDKVAFIKKDPLFFKELIEKACADPDKLIKTKEYIYQFKQQVESITPTANKLLSQLKPNNLDKKP